MIEMPWRKSDFRKVSRRRRRHPDERMTLPGTMLARRKSRGNEGSGDRKKKKERGSSACCYAVGKYYPLSHPAPIIVGSIHGRSFIPDPLFNLLMGQFPSKRRMIRPISISVPFSERSHLGWPATPSISISISHLWSMSYFM